MSDNPKFTREVRVRPAYDKRHKDPSKNYGIHGADLSFYLKGPEGAIQFVIYTNWMLPRVAEEQRARTAQSGDVARTIESLYEPLPADLGYHSKRAMYEGQDVRQDECEWTGGPCYYDGSGLYAQKVYDLLVREGSDAVWALMEREYTERFEGAE